MDRHEPDTVDAPRVAQMKRDLQAKGVQYCFAAYVDVHGIPKAKVVPIAKFEEMCAGGECEGMGLVGPQEDECQTVPDLDSCIICPWDGRYAWFSADLTHHGQPYGGASRVILRNALRQARAMGYTFALGVEPEFYVLRKDAHGRYAPLAPVPFKQPNACYDVRQTLMSMDFLDPMCRYIEQLGWGVHSFDQECGRGQFEFDFHFADALTMADRFTFLRLMAKEVAASVGAIATFMRREEDVAAGLGVGEAHVEVRAAAIVVGERLGEDLDPGEPLNDNLYTSSKGDADKRRVQRLPQTLLESVRAFEESPLVAATFGTDFQQIYAEQKYKEWTRGFYRVSDDEREEMLTYI